MASDPKSRIDHPNICSKLVKLALYENLKLHSSFRFIINFIVLLQLAEMKLKASRLRVKFNEKIIARKFVECAEKCERAVSKNCKEF